MDDGRCLLRGEPPIRGLGDLVGGDRTHPVEVRVNEVGVAQQGLVHIEQVGPFVDDRQGFQPVPFHLRPGPLQFGLSRPAGSELGNDLVNGSGQLLLGDSRCG